MNTPQRICLGVIVGVKGLRGEVRIKSFTEDPADVDAYGPVTASDGRIFTLSVVGAAQGVVIAQIKGVADRTAAEALKGLELYVDRAALPPAAEGTYYHADLIGAEVVLATGEMLGEVLAFHDYGGGDMMEVKRPGADSVLVPMAGGAVTAIDIAARKVTVDPLPGLFDGGDDEGGEGREEEGKDGHEA